MKKYRLSSSAERFAAFSISALLLAGMAVLLRILWGDWFSFTLCAAACLLVAAVLVFYVLNLNRAACVPQGDQAQLAVLGYPDVTVDLAQARSVETAAYQAGPIATRTVIFRDDSGNAVATVPTFFTAWQGAAAEPMAMKLAEDLNLEFKPSLQGWEYDPRLRREHQKEVAAQEKKQRKEKIARLKAKLLRKPLAAEAAQEHPEEEQEYEYTGINYDALDDIK